MCQQRLKSANAQAASGSVLVCVALICGAMFGMAAQASLLHLGLDFGSVRDDLIVGAVARPRSALAWWAWWLLPVGAFLIGPLSIVLTRRMADWWLFRTLPVVACTAVVLALAAIGKLAAAPTTLDLRSGAAASLIVVTLSALLAWLGARLLANLGRETAHGRTPVLPARRTSARLAEQARFRVSAPIQAAPPRRGGGSAAAGAPFVRKRQPHALVARCTLGHLALVAMLAIVVCAAVIGVSGVTVLVEHARPGDTRQLLAWSGLRPNEPPRAARAIGLAAVAPPAQVAQEKPAGMVIDGVVVPESELTFAKGYLKRRTVIAAAILAAEHESARIVAAAEKAEARIPAKLKHVAALQPVRYGRGHRRITRVRHIERHVEQHAERHHRGHRHYTRERHSAPRRPVRARDHRRIRGHDRFALEPHYRVARF
jgi:hypothetical protein